MEGVVNPQRVDIYSYIGPFAILNVDLRFGMDEPHLQ